MTKYIYNETFKTKKSAFEYAESQGGNGLAKLEKYNIYKVIDAEVWYTIRKIGANKWELCDYINVESIAQLVQELGA